MLSFAPSTAENAGGHAVDRPSTAAATKAKTMRATRPGRLTRASAQRRSNDGCRAKRRPTRSPLRGLGRRAVVRERGRVERAVGISGRATASTAQVNDVLVNVASRSVASKPRPSAGSGEETDPISGSRSRWRGEIGRLGWRVQEEDQTTRKGSGADATPLRQARSPTPRTAKPLRFARRRPPP